MQNLTKNQKLILIGAIVLGVIAIVAVVLLSANHTNNNKNNSKNGAIKLDQTTKNSAHEGNTVKPEETNDLTIFNYTAADSKIGSTDARNAMLRAVQRSLVLDKSTKDGVPVDQTYDVRPDSDNFTVYPTVDSGGYFEGKIDESSIKDEGYWICSFDINISKGNTKHKKVHVRVDNTGSQRDFTSVEVTLL